MIMIKHSLVAEKRQGTAVAFLRMLGRRILATLLGLVEALLLGRRLPE